MSSGFSTYLSNKVLLHALGKTAFTQPSTLYVALFTSAPSAAGGGTEVSGSNYARATLAPSALSVTNNVATTNADITFATPSGSWNTVVAAAIFDALTSGNMLAFGDLSVSKTIAQDDIIKFASGNITITLS